MIIYDEIESFGRAQRLAAMGPDAMAMYQQLKARGIAPASRRLIIEFQQMIDALPEGADTADALHEWSANKVRAKFEAAMALAERYPGVADVAAKYTKPEAGYYAARQAHAHYDPRLILHPRDAADLELAYGEYIPTPVIPKARR